MYTLTGTVAEVYAFLKGFTSGLANHRSSSEMLEYPILGEWEDFRYWLGEELNVNYTRAFDELIEKYPEQEKATQILKESYERFIGDERRFE